MCPASITDKNKVLYLNCPQPKGLKWPGQEVQSASIAEMPIQQIMRDGARGVLRGFPDKREAAVRLWDAVGYEGSPTSCNPASLLMGESQGQAAFMERRQNTSRKAAGTSSQHLLRKSRQRQ